MRRALAATAVLLTLALTGCETGQEQGLRLGIECHEAGGEWIFHPDQGANRQGVSACQFTHQKTETP